MKKQVLSPTKITTYLACPEKYKWTYLDKRGKWYMRAKHYYSFGTTLHRVLEKFHDDSCPEVKSMDQVLSDMEQNWLTAGYSCGQEMQEAMMEAKEILSTYVQKHSQRRINSETIFLEKQFSEEYKQFKLIGRVDRIDRREDGTLEIIDYKTGRTDVTSKEVAEDVAMSIYQLLLKKMYPLEDVTATIVALKTGNEASYSLDKDELNEFEQDVVKVGEEIVSVEPEDTIPQPKSLCINCDFQRLCSKSPEFMERAEESGISAELKFLK